MPISPLEALRQRNAAAGRPAQLTGRQKGGIISGAIITAVLAAVYVKEGGYADHPSDRGGKTMYGVTEATARSYGYRGAMRDFPKHCTDAQPICADRVYTERYIKQPGFEPMAAIEPAVLFELVDSAVLHGPGRPSAWFRASLNELCGTRFAISRVTVDAETTTAYADCAAAVGKVSLCLRMLDRMDAKQEAFFRSIVANNPSQRVFLKGWLRHRVGNVPRAKCTEESP